jgi:hypothetical protein
MAGLGGSYYRRAIDVRGRRRAVAAATRAFKKMLAKRLPAAIRAEMVASLEQGGRAMLGRMQRSEAPVRTGADPQCPVDARAARGDAAQGRPRRAAR